MCQGPLPSVLRENIIMRHDLLTSPAQNPSSFEREEWWIPDPWTETARGVLPNTESVYFGQPIARGVMCQSEQYILAMIVHKEQVCAVLGAKLP